MPDGQVPTDLGLTDTRQAVNSAAQSAQTIDAKRAAIEAAIEAHRPQSAALNNSETLPPPPRGASPLCASSLEEQWRSTEEEFNAFLDQGSSFCKPAQSAAVTPEKPTPANRATSSFCNPPATPRNALCPCGSGVKYKRCCGTNAPPVLNNGGAN
jgi:uncharacterized protein YchJ